MIITANGTYQLTAATPSQAHSINLSGTTGGATVTISYLNSLGAIVPYTDGLIAIDTQKRLDHGIGATLYAVVASASGTTLIALEAWGFN
jgi:hypothetical protein